MNIYLLIFVYFIYYIRVFVKFLDTNIKKYVKSCLHDKSGIATAHDMEPILSWFFNKSPHVRQFIDKEYQLQERDLEIRRIQSFSSQYLL